MDIDFFTLEINLDQKKYAMALAKSSGIGNRRSGANGSFIGRYAGLLGETVLCDRLSESRPTDKGFDRGVDFVFYNTKVGLKTITRVSNFRPGSFVNNLFSSQVNGKQYETDIYLFANINTLTSVMEFIGSISKYDVIAEVEGVTLHRKGVERTRTNGTKMIPKADFYEVKYNALKPFRSPEEFRIGVAGFKLP